MIEIDDERTRDLAARLTEGDLSSLNELILSPVSDELAQELEALIAERKPVVTEEASSQTNAEVISPASLTQMMTSFWHSLETGALVLAADLDRQGSPEAWFEAYIVSIDDEMIQLRWRDFPREGILTRTRRQIALLHPAD